MLRKVSYRFSKQQTSSTSSLKRFFMKYELEPALPKLAPPPQVLSKETGQKEVHLKPSKLKKEIVSNFQLQEEELKKKFLFNRVKDCKEFKEDNTYYNFFTRPQNLYVKERNKMHNERKEKSHVIVRELQKGEDGIDQVRLPEDYLAAINHERLKGINWMKNAIQQLQEHVPDKNKSEDVKTWRENNKLLEPIDIKINPHLLEQYRKSTENSESIIENPKSFAEWFVKTQPRETVEQLSKLSQSLKLNQRQRREENQIREVQTQFSSQTDIYTFGHSAIMQDTISNIQMSNIEQALTEQQQPMVFRSKLYPGELEPFPNADPLTHEDLMYLLERWSVFRMIPKLQKVFHSIQDGSFEEMILNTATPDDEKYAKMKTGSLMAYYQTLPKFMRDDPNVKNVFRGLEFHQPTMSLEQKQKSLNLACKLVLPMNPLTNDACEDLQVNTKIYPSRFDEMKLIQNVQTDIIDPHFNPNALDAYIFERKQKMHEFHGEDDWPKPEVMEKFEAIDNLPVDYYDNDDGFWDTYIKEKYEKYAKDIPIRASRQFFKH